MPDVRSSADTAGVLGLSPEEKIKKKDRKWWHLVVFAVKILIYKFCVFYNISKLNTATQLKIELYQVIIFKKMGRFFGRSYLRLATINQANKRLFCYTSCAQLICKKNSKILLVFFHLEVDIDLSDCLVEKSHFSWVKRM